MKAFGFNSLKVKVLSSNWFEIKSAFKYLVSNINLHPYNVAGLRPLLEKNSGILKV